MALFRLSSTRNLTRATIPTCRPIPLRTFIATPYLRSQSEAEPEAPSVLSQLQPDLKSALRAKDKVRLSILRTLMADITNASKTSKPITSDTSFYGLLSRQIKASTSAVQEFRAAKRDDLVRKELDQLNILEGYRGLIEVVGEEEIESAVKAVVEELGDKAKVGSVTGKVMGRFAGRPLDAEVVKSKVEAAVV